MKIFIVYDSFFGNTEKIAQAIADSLTETHDVILKKVKDAVPSDTSVANLVIAGSPTRAFQPTKDIKTFINNIPPNSLRLTSVAVFDTRISQADIHSSFLNFMIRIFGYAAETMAGKLIRKGGIRAGHPEGFFVSGSEGPLKEGELERAKIWAEDIVKAVTKQR